MEMTDTGKPLWFLTCLVVVFNLNPAGMALCELLD